MVVLEQVRGVNIGHHRRIYRTVRAQCPHNVSSHLCVDKMEPKSLNGLGEPSVHVLCASDDKRTSHE
jgi:hypothetical protein